MKNLVLLRAGARGWGPRLSEAKGELDKFVVDVDGRSVVRERGAGAPGYTQPRNDIGTARNSMVARTDKTLVVPLVAMGSVPQYAVQLVIDARREQLHKQPIDSLYVYPFAGREMSVAEVVGGRAASAGEMVSPWELYYSDEDGADADYMQMHSPVIPGCESLYVKQLVQLVRQRGYARVVLLDALDKGLWHGDSPVAPTPPGPESEVPPDVPVLRWGNRTLGGMKLAVDDETPAGQTDDADASAVWPGPLVRLVGEQVDAAGEDVAVEALAVPVYDGWNAPAARALLRAARVGGPLAAAGGETAAAEGPASDRDGLARLEGVYN